MLLIESFKKNQWGIQLSYFSKNVSSVVNCVVIFILAAINAFSYLFITIQV